MTVQKNRFLSEYQIKFFLNNYPKLNIKEIWQNVGKDMSYRSFCYTLRRDKYTNGLIGNTLTTARIQRKSVVDDAYFSVLNAESCYWAGFIAADGCICGEKLLVISLQAGDSKHLENFLSALKSDYKVKIRMAKKIFPQARIQIVSEQICKDLGTNFNIVPAKSLILQFPENLNNELLDAFIVGVIDGDGCIGLYNSKGKRQKRLSISLISGSVQFIQKIADRFSEILEIPVKVHKEKKNPNRNTICLSDKNARKLFMHYYSLNTPKMIRKWKPEIYDYCFNYKKYYNKDKLIKMIMMHNFGMTKTEIANYFGITYQAIDWCFKKSESLNLFQEITSSDYESIELDTSGTSKASLQNKGKRRAGKALENLKLGAIKRAKNRKIELLQETNNLDADVVDIEADQDLSDDSAGINIFPESNIG